MAKKTYAVVVAGFYNFIYIEKIKVYKSLHSAIRYAIKEGVKIYEEESGKKITKKKKDKIKKEIKNSNYRQYIFNGVEPGVIILEL
jgi:predicted peroxiredoxin